MENASIIAGSRAVALERQMAVIANNVANMGTTGFKAGVPLFIDHLEKPTDGESYNLVENRTIMRDLAAGPMQQTGNPLDVALEGTGYFAVDTLNGVRYTRSGNFTLNDARELTTASGLPVLDETGNRITLPPNAREIRIGNQGSISTELGPVARLNVIRFEREQFMTPLGNSLYATNEKPLTAEGTLVRQGFLEGSNVQSVTQMADMVEVNRQYQSIQRLLQGEHERLRNAYSKLTKLT